MYQNCLGQSWEHVCDDAYDHCNCIETRLKGRCSSVYTFYLPFLFLLFPVLWGPGIETEHCVLESIEGNVTIHPIAEECYLNGNKIKKPTRLSQGLFILSFTVVFKNLSTFFI